MTGQEGCPPHYTGTTAAAMGCAPTGTMVNSGAGSVRRRRWPSDAMRITAILPDRQLSTSA